MATTTKPTAEAITEAATKVGAARVPFDAAMTELSDLLATADPDEVNVQQVANLAGTDRKTIYRRMGKDY